MKSANPYLTFDGNAEEAFTFYKSVFGGDFAVVLRFRDMGGGPPGTPPHALDRIAHVALPLGTDDMLMASDVLPSQGHGLAVGTNFHIALSPETGEEAERVFTALAVGGRVDMPLQPTVWAEKYGVCTDRFGVQWMVSYAGGVQFTASAPAPAGAPSTSQYLVISRGQWDPTLSREQIQSAIDAFYVWLDGLVADGRMKTGQRLAPERKTVSRGGRVTDGPFAESKEVIGGYWFILAKSLDEAATIAAGNPCLECGLSYEIRPIESQRASAFTVTTETPSERRGG